MRWGSTVSVASSLETAVAEASERLLAELGGERPSFVAVFVSRHHAGGYARVPALIARRFGAAVVIGCSAGAVIGGGREVEGQPGVSMTAAVLPGVEVVPFHVEKEQMAAGAWDPTVAGKGEEPSWLLLSDPFTFDAQSFLETLDGVFPRSPKVGGLASSGGEPGENALFLGERVLGSGLVGLALRGDVAVETIVAQGCRPIGEPLFVTRCRHDVLLELDGRPPIEVLGDLYRKLAPRDRELFRGSLFLGVVMDEERQRYGQGDFLIRNLVSADEQNGALTIGALLREGAIVQFHLRDARTSAEDLERLLSRYGQNSSPPSGALLFSCLGRGKHLYGRPDHDTAAFRRHLGEVPLGGFFCNGEIGPVQGRTFLHGYTSSFGLFRPKLVPAF